MKASFLKTLFCFFILVNSAIGQQPDSIYKKRAEIAVLENRDLRKENERNKLVSLSIITALILLIIIIMLYGLYRRSLLRRATERQKLTGDLYKLEAGLNDERAVSQGLQQSIIKDERKKISESIHDEVLSGMAALRYRIAYNKGKTEDEKVKHMLKGMEEDVLALYLQAKDFLMKMNESALPSFRNYDVTGLIKALSARFNNESMLKITYDCDEEEIEKQFTDTVHYELYFVIKEIVAVFIKDTDADRIKIRLFFTGSTGRLVITGNGNRFDENILNAGAGLQNLQNRIKNLNGTPTINSYKKETVIQLSFPVSPSDK